MKIAASHKAASTLQQNIYNSINSLLNKDVINFHRIRERFPEWFEEAIDVDIIVLRHPINRIISKYYSYGWTHSTAHFNEQSWKTRKDIQSQTLGDFATANGRLYADKKTYDRIFDLYAIRNKIQNDEEKLTLIKYEDMMDNPRKFIALVLSKINKPILLDIIYEKFQHEFIFDGKDQSYDIINNKKIIHKRNLDHKEYLSKLNKEELEKIHKVLSSCIEQYEMIKKL